jgi:hypothetical protein
MRAAGMAREGRTSAFASRGHDVASGGRDGLPWAFVGDDDSETVALEARKDELRVSWVRGACDKHLEDLRQHGAPPRNVRLKER